MSPNVQHAIPYHTMPGPKTGLRKDGKLLPGYVYAKGGRIVRTKATRRPARRGGDGGGVYEVAKAPGDGDCYFHALRLALGDGWRSIMGCGENADHVECLRRVLSALCDTEHGREMVGHVVRMAAAIGREAAAETFGECLAGAATVGDAAACVASKGAWATQFEHALAQRFLLEKHNIFLEVSLKNPDENVDMWGSVMAKVPPGEDLKNYRVAFLKKAGSGNHYDAWVRPGGPENAREYIQRLALKLATA